MRDLQRAIVNQQNRTEQSAKTQNQSINSQVEIKLLTPPLRDFIDEGRKGENGTQKRVNDERHHCATTL
jgi:hypothetical protein